MHKSIVNEFILVMGWRSLGMSPLARILSLFRLYIQQSLNVHRATRPSICQSPVKKSNQRKNCKKKQIKLLNYAMEWQVRR